MMSPRICGVRPGLSHSTWVMCGTTGFSTRSNSERPSRTSSTAAAESSNGALLESLEHLHAGRHDRVVLDALVVVVGLLQLQVELAADRAQLAGAAPDQAIVCGAVASASRRDCAYAHRRFRNR